MFVSLKGNSILSSSVGIGGIFLFSNNGVISRFWGEIRSSLQFRVSMSSSEYRWDLVLFVEKSVVNPIIFLQSLYQNNVKQTN